MKAQKYYKLVPNTGEQQINYLLEFATFKRTMIEKRINYGKQNQPPYLLVEKTQHENGSESYTDIKPVYNESCLMKAIGNKTCFDYSGMTLTVWSKGKHYSWDTYTNK